VHYYLGKVYVVADTLSHKAHCNYLPVVPLTGEESNIRVLPDLSLYNMTLTPILRDEIIISQKNDEGVAHMRRRLSKGDLKVNCFCEDAEGILWFNDRLVVPKKAALKKMILGKTHTSIYFIHPGSVKMYHGQRQQLWWTRMKCETTRYMLQPLSITAWK
jgi:hypothetical protein